MSDQPLSPETTETTDERQQPQRGPARDPRKIIIDTSKTDEVFLFGTNRLVVGMLDRNSKGEDRALVEGTQPEPIDPQTELNITGTKDIKIDLKNAAQNEAKEIRISAAEGRDSEQTVVTGFTGRPPLRIDDGKVSVQMSAEDAFGFSASAGADASSANVSSNITLVKGKDGIVVKRGNEVLMTVENDAVADIRDKDGNVILTIDGSKDLEENQKAFDKAREKAFKQFKKDVADKDSPSYNEALAKQTLTYVDAQTLAQQQQAAQQPAAPNPVMQAARDQFNQVAAGAQQTAMSTGKELLTSAVSNAVGIPRVPGVGGRG